MPRLGDKVRGGSRAVTALHADLEREQNRVSERGRIRRPGRVRLVRALKVRNPSGLRDVAHNADEILEVGLEPILIRNLRKDQELHTVPADVHKVAGLEVRIARETDLIL